MVRERISELKEERDAWRNQAERLLLAEPVERRVSGAYSAVNRTSRFSYDQPRSNKIQALDPPP